MDAVKDMSLEEIKDALSKVNYTPESLKVWSLSKSTNIKINKFIIEASKDFYEHPNFLMRYDYSVHFEGVPEFREAVSGFLNRFYKHEVKSDMIVATFGATFGFRILITTLFDQGDCLFLEDLSYIGSIETARQYGMKLIPCSLDKFGINIVELESKIKSELNNRECTPDKPYAGCIYLIPQLHNPTGISYSEKRCKEILALALKYNLLVLCDDIYFTYHESDSDRIPDNISDVLVSYDIPNWSNGIGNVVSNGSFSKILFPSIRMGWLQCSPWLVQKMINNADNQSCGGYNVYNQYLLATILKHKTFIDYFHSLKLYFNDTLNLACDYLEQNLPEGVTFDRPKGSFFIWMSLPEQYDAQDLLELCEQYHTSFLTSAGYSPTPTDKYKNCFRLSVTNLEERHLLMSLKVVCTQCKVLLG